MKDWFENFQNKLEESDTNPVSWFGSILVFVSILYPSYLLVAAGALTCVLGFFLKKENRMRNKYAIIGIVLSIVNAALIYFNSGK